jgi:uncharacterized protein YggE
MKKNILAAALLITLAALITGCAGGLTSPEKATVRTIDVTGIGKVKIEPNIAHVNIGVRSRSPEVMEAFNENSEIAENIIQTLMDMGIEQKDIQTRNFNIFQQQDQPRGEEEPTISYIVENTVAVTVRDLDSLGEVLSVIVSEGANTIHGITFDIEDREAAIEEARQMAIEDAKSQAEAIADTASVNLGDIRSINISQDGGAIPRVEYAEEAAMGAGEVPISSGTMTIQVRASLSYDID